MIVFSAVELFAWCERDNLSITEEDKAHAGHLYRVNSFEYSCMGYPYTIVLSDKNGNELSGSFLLQNFSYFNFHLN